MAIRQGIFTASEVGNIVVGEDDDPEYIFPGSDDDFDASLDDIQDPLDREQGIVVTDYKCMYMIYK